MLSFKNVIDNMTLFPIKQEACHFLCYLSRKSNNVQMYFPTFSPGNALHSAICQREVSLKGMET